MILINLKFEILFFIKPLTIIVKENSFSITFTRYNFFINKSNWKILERIKFFYIFCIKEFKNDSILNFDIEQIFIYFPKWINLEYPFYLSTVMINYLTLYIDK
jgi:hypothetical protein